MSDCLTSSPCVPGTVTSKPMACCRQTEGATSHPSNQRKILSNSAVLHEAVFTIAKIWKRPKCPLINERINERYIHTTECYSAAKEGNLAICDDMDGPRECYAK